MKRLVFAAAWLVVGVLAAQVAVAKEKTGLADATVVIVRHGEKPDEGAGLSPAGEARAKAYEDAAKAARAKIPDAKPNADPWASVRSNEPARSAGTAKAKASAK